MWPKVESGLIFTDKAKNNTLRVWWGKLFSEKTLSPTRGPCMYFTCTIV